MLKIFFVKKFIENRKLINILMNEHEEESKF